jgi:membrane-bound lytic murein transglycosylase D
MSISGCASQKLPEAASQDNTPAMVAQEQENPASPQPADTRIDGVRADASAAAHEDKTAITADDDQGLLDTALELTETAQEYWEDNDMDQAIESLDQAYALILKVPNNQKITQQKEDLRFMISKRIMEMYASRQTTVKGSYNAIPLVVNDHVKREIQSFQTVERDFFMESYKRSGRYRNSMAQALKDSGLPEELSWLPLIESGFKIRALSRSRAFGLWQFIPSTGYKFGLKRNAWIDERLDPDKSTAAAIAYFKELHQMFGDWATVLAAYNCGEGAVGRVIRNQKVNYLDYFWDFYERLPRETARYFPRFLAVLTIINDPAQYGFSLTELDQPLPYEAITIERPVHLSAMAAKLGIEPGELSALNPELRRDATPNTSYSLRVPPGKGEALLASLDKMPKWSPPQIEYVVHRVRRGETLSLLALRYRTSTEKIMEANNLRRGKLLRIGQRLKIPVKNSA